jgi:hypothetical protein
MVVVAVVIPALDSQGFEKILHVDLLWQVLVGLVC